ARRHPWPGNVRALRNAVLRAANLADGPIGPSDLLVPLPAPPPVYAAQDCGPGVVRVPRGDYASMRYAMLAQLVAEHGSIRKAAAMLRIPRSTLSTWLRRSPPSTDPDVSA